MLRWPSRSRRVSTMPRWVTPYCPAETATRSRNDKPGCRPSPKSPLRGARLGLLEVAQMRYFAFALVLLLAGASVHAQEEPSYARQVRPFLGKYCLECHNPNSLKAGLDL